MWSKTSVVQLASKTAFSVSINTQVEGSKRGPADLFYFAPLEQLVGAVVLLLHQIATQHWHQRPPLSHDPLFLFNFLSRKVTSENWDVGCMLLCWIYVQSWYIISKQLSPLNDYQHIFVLGRTPKKFTHSLVVASYKYPP